MNLGVRARLTLISTIAIGVLIAALGAFLYLRLSADLLAAVDFDLRSRAQPIVAALPATQSFDQPQDGVIDPDEAFAQLLDGSGAIIETTPGVAAGPLIGAGTVSSITSPTFFTRDVPGLDDPVRLLAIPSDRGDHEVVVVGSTLGDRNDALHRLLLLLALAGPVAVGICAAGAWVVAGAALRPVERMRAEAAAISASELDRRLGSPGTGDELDRLAVTLNALLERLQEAVERERRFVDDASHELRTPLAVLKTELDLAAGRGRDRVELEAAVTAAASETDRLVALAEDLLVLARSRGGVVPLRREPSSLRVLVEEACSTARGSTADVVCEVTDAVVEVDPVRVKQAIANLVDNALHHGGSPVLVRAERNDGSVRFEVSDRGPGFSHELLERAFEPFTRGGDAKGRRGAGLGLAIVKAVADAHGGRVSAENLSDGARLTLVLPVPPTRSEVG